MPRLNLDVRPEAELDALEAASWDDGERNGLGLEFLTELRATFARIEEGPQQNESDNKRPNHALEPSALARS